MLWILKDIKPNFNSAIVLASNILYRNRKTFSGKTPRFSIFARDFCGRSCCPVRFSFCCSYFRFRCSFRCRRLKFELQDKLVGF